jgi:hypothetical protein
MTALLTATLTPAGRRPVKPSCNGGIDPWIAQHWPQAFPRGIGWDFQYASGFESLPDESYIWVDAGFPASQFTALNGTTGQCLPGGGGTLFSFDTFFPGNVAPVEGIPIPFVPGEDPFS